MNTQKKANSFSESMRPLLNKIEPLVLIAWLSLALLKTFMSFPGISVLLILSGGTLSYIYIFYFILVSGDSNLPSLFNSSIKFGYLGMSILIIGFLFKLMFWPYSFMMLLIGSAISVLCGSGLYYYKNLWPGYEIHINLSQFFKKIGGLVIVGLLLLVISNKQWYRLTHKDSEQVKRYERMIDNPTNEEYKKEYFDYLKK